MATSVVGRRHVTLVQGALEGNAVSSSSVLSGRVAVKASRCRRVVGIRAASQNANGSAVQSVGVNFGGKLRLFIDTADAESWQRWLPSGAFYGVTTNPILLEKANVTCQVETLSDLAHRAFDLGAEEVQIQTWGQTVDEMVSTGSKLVEIRPGAIVVKIPVTKIGLQAASQLTKSGISVTMTGVYSVHQALLAVGVGAAYAAPYLGRMVALGKPGMEDIQEMQKIVTGVQSDLRLLVASIKDVQQITRLAASGVNSFAIPVPIIEKLFQDDDTEKAAADFEEAVSRTLKINAAATRARRAHEAGNILQVADSRLGTFLPSDAKVLRLYGEFELQEASFIQVTGNGILDAPSFEHGYIIIHYL